MISDAPPPARRTSAERAETRTYPHHVGVAAAGTAESSSHDAADSAFRALLRDLCVPWLRPRPGPFAFGPYGPFVLGPEAPFVFTDRIVTLGDRCWLGR